jgi:PTS system fructose-specific IIB component
MNTVAVAACPTGVAHGRLAAENLGTTAEETGHEIEVEVQGSMGAENELTADDIAAAGVITADTAVQQDRFEGEAPGEEDGDGRGRQGRRGRSRGRTARRGGEGDAGGRPEPDPSPGATSRRSRRTPSRRGGDREKGLFAR